MCPPETPIQSLLKGLGEQPDLGEAARAIASAMQAVGAEGEPRGAEKGAAGKPRESDAGRRGGGVPGEAPGPRVTPGCGAVGRGGAVQRPGSPSGHTFLLLRRGGFVETIFLRVNFCL